MNLLFLHPLPLDGSVFSDELRSLGDECVAPTLYSEGDDIVDWARAALDAVGDGPVVVVGNSIGGSCAIEVARLAPTKVKALVLCGAKAGHRPEPDFRDEALRVLEDRGLRAAWERYWLPLFGPEASAEVVERAWNVAVKQGADAIAAGIRAFHGRPDREEFLRGWPGPVHVVSGEYDIKPERGRRLAEELPAGEFHLFRGVGHYVPLEAPAELTLVSAEAMASLV
jgi:pimeloyl-ACP methyl ester carboxylesterase